MTLRVIVRLLLIFTDSIQSLSSLLLLCLESVITNLRHFSLYLRAYSTILFQMSLLLFVTIFRIPIFWSIFVNVLSNNTFVQLLVPSRLRM